MPELPEVETIKLQLKKYLTGHKITGVEIKVLKIFEGDAKNIIGGKVKNIRRFAKVLSIDLSNGYSLVIHIKLTGQLIYRGSNLTKKTELSKKIVGGVPGPHTHIIFELDKKGFLYYNDIRRFGWIKVFKTDEVEKTGFVAKLGPEPHVAESSAGQAILTFNLFEKILSSSKRPVKIVIMDQEKMGGVGNIYANDALWLSKINPKTPANEIKETKVKELYNAIHTVLKSGLKYGGASELSFVTPDGTEGKYQDHTLVYGHQGDLCRNCKKTKINKYFLGGRGTYTCAICQTL